jgi:hypothetical protein
LSTTVPLERDALMGAAQEATGLEDWGEDTSFIEGLDVLLSDFRETAGLNDAGRAAQAQDVMRLLVNRLFMQKDLSEHPKILEEELLPPIVILGLPRTGTSKLQRTIAADPGMQRLEVWRLVSPARIPGVSADQPDPRIAIGEQFEAMLRQVPEFMARHPMEAHEPDEDLWLMELTFAAGVASHRLHCPNHRAWIADRQPEVYAFARKALQYLQWQDGGARGRPWVLKSPMHIGNAATLAELYPGATLVQCHREPRKVMGSYCSLLEVARRMNCDDVDLAELGADFCAYWGEQTERNLDDREREGVEILDVGFERIRDDIDGVVAEVYERAGHELTPEAEAAFEDYNNRRPADHFGAHEYDPDRWGVTHELVASSFERYLSAFPELKESA